MDSEFTLGTDAAEYDAAPFHNMQLLHESKEGHCRVFLCEHYGRKVVVKALREKYRDSEVYRRMLRKEFTIAASMTHENIVSALFFNEVPGFGLCIVMEYFDGVTLTEYMHGHPHLTALSFKIWSHCREMCYFIARAVRTEMSFSL